MTRREYGHDYTRPGFYHITLHVGDALGQLLGAVAGTDADSATVCLTPIGQMVEQELLTAITAHYEMITVDAYVIMPDHLHCILIVRAPIVSKSGRSTHLGQVIAGFKTGWNRRFWAMTGQQAPAVKPQGTLAAPVAALSTPGTATLAALGPAAPALAAPGPAAPAPAARVSGGSTAGIRTVSGRAPLFAYGYCDVQPIEAGQLETQRAYIRNNPRSRWLRSHDRTRLQPRRGGIDTAVTPAALRRYLQQTCPPSQACPDALDQIEHRLLLTGGTITCDSYGDRALLQRRLLPVVCHRKDTARFSEQKARCLEAAARGVVLVSACISPREREIIDEAARHGFPVVLIADNGFPQVYHPSTDRIDRCADGRLLLVTPWQYQYRGKDEAVTVPFCKTMNCMAQALCCKSDSWWKKPACPAVSPRKGRGTGPPESARKISGRRSRRSRPPGTGFPCAAASGKRKDMLS